MAQKTEFKARILDRSESRQVHYSATLITSLLERRTGKITVDLVDPDEDFVINGKAAIVTFFFYLRTIKRHQ